MGNEESILVIYTRQHHRRITAIMVYMGAQWGAVLYPVAARGYTQSTIGKPESVGDIYREMSLR